MLYFSEPREKSSGSKMEGFEKLLNIQAACTKASDNASSKDICRYGLFTMRDGFDEFGRYLKKEVGALREPNIVWLALDSVHVHANTAALGSKSSIQCFSSTPQQLDSKKRKGLNATEIQYKHSSSLETRRC